MIRRQPAIEHAEALFLQRAALDAVGMEHRRMRGKTGPDRRGGMLPRPIDQRAQRLPIRLVHQALGARLGAGDDQAVERRVPQFGNIAIALGELAARGRLRAALPGWQIISIAPRHSASPRGSDR